MYSPPAAGSISVVGSISLAIVWLAAVTTAQTGPQGLTDLRGVERWEVDGEVQQIVAGRGLQQSRGQCTVRKDTDWGLGGSEFKTLNFSSDGDCCAACGAESGCFAWVWRLSGYVNGGNCYLKAAEVAGTGFFSHVGVNSGYNPLNPGCPRLDTQWCIGAGQVANNTDCDGDGLLDWTCTSPQGQLGTMLSGRLINGQCLWTWDNAPVTSCPQIFSRFVPTPGWSWGVPGREYKNTSATSSQDCFNQCAQDTGRTCFAWAFDNATNVCSLKARQPAGTTNNGFYQASGIVSGNINGDAPAGVFVPNLNLTWGADGSEYAWAATPTSLDCYSQCVQDQANGCFAWVWDPQAADPGHTCLLKAQNSTAPVGNNYKGFVFSPLVTAGTLAGDVLDCPEYANFTGYTYFAGVDDPGRDVAPYRPYTGAGMATILADGKSYCSTLAGCNSFGVYANNYNWDYSVNWKSSTAPTSKFPFLDVTSFKPWRCTGLYVRSAEPPPPQPKPPVPPPPSPPLPPPPSPPPSPPAPPGSLPAPATAVPVATADASPPSSSVNAGVIAGAVVGVVVGVAALALLAWWVMKRRLDRSTDIASLPAGQASGPTGSAEVTVLMAGGDKQLLLPSTSEKMAATTASAVGSSTAIAKTGPGVSSTRGTIGPSGSSSSVKGSTVPSLGGASSQAAASIQENMLSKLSIPWESIEIGKVLGSGGFASVYRGVWQENLVAVKMLNLNRLDDSALDELRREALAMCELRHPCIAQVYGLVDDGTHRALVMRYYKRGTVADVIAKPEYANLELAQRVRMAVQVASGMCYLHERHLLHGDLKTSNLLIEETGRGVVIADFGLAGAVGQAVASGAMTVTISPPEVLLDPKAPRTAAGDVYAFGIVLLEIVTGRIAYQGMRAAQLKDAVISGKRPTIPEYVPLSERVIAACWAQEAATRPIFADVMKWLVAAEEEQRSSQGLSWYRGYTTTATRAMTLSDLTSSNLV